MLHAQADAVKLVRHSSDHQECPQPPTWGLEPWSTHAPELENGNGKLNKAPVSWFRNGAPYLELPLKRKP